MDKVKNQYLVLDARMIKISGIGRYIQVLIPTLIENFSQITLLGKKSEINEFEWSPNVNVIELSDLLYSITEQLNIFRKTPTCDIFISPHYNVPIYLPQAKRRIAIIPDVNHLVFLDDFSFFKRMYAKIFYNLAVFKSDLIFTISDFSKSEIIKYTKCKPNKICVAKCAIDTKYFENIKTSLLNNSNYFNLNDINEYAKTDYILFVGNIKPHKNLKRSLLAFEAVIKKAPDLKFIIAGRNDKLITADIEIYSLINTNKALKEKVIFTGTISDLSIAYLYAHAKCLVFASLYEGFGIPPLEAMFFRCPVISSREGSLPEICGDAVLYCNAFDSNDIADKMTSILNDNDLRNALIKKGAKKVLEYDWNSFSRIIVEQIKLIKN